MLRLLTAIVLCCCALAAPAQTPLADDAAYGHQLAENVAPLVAGLVDGGLELVLVLYVVWELTLRCDHACTHCGSRAGKDRPDELSTDPVRCPDPLWGLSSATLTRKTSNPPALAVWNAPGVTGKSVELVTNAVRHAGGQRRHLTDHEGRGR